MNKKEVLEIRRQYSPQHCAITRICGCYVDGEKEKKLIFKDAFLSLPEEEAFKYFELLKKGLSGTVGKNLLNMDFPIDEELADGKQEFLLKLRNSQLKDDALLEEFYDKVIEHYDFAENYLILLIHSNYDIPGKSTDGLEMFDASDEVYEYIQCILCPVALSKAGLCYNAMTNAIQDRIRDWVVGEPMEGFLFPAFTDRQTDVHHLLLYSKNAEEIHPVFIENVLGCHEVLTAGDQKMVFQDVLAETLQEDLSFSVVRAMHENLQEMITEAKEREQTEPVEIDKMEMKNLLAKSGVSDEKLPVCEKAFETSVGEKASLLASNITETRTFSVKVPEVVVKVSPDRTDLIEIMEIEGRKCLVIPVEDEIEVNGLVVRPE